MRIPWRDKNFLHATAMLIGTMVGAGIFGIPFAFAKAGFFVGFGFLIITVTITLLFDLIVAEIALRTNGQHQIVGFAQLYMGPWSKRMMFFSYLVGIYGALLAYIVIAGEFLNNIFSHFFYVAPGTYNVIFFILVSLIIPFGLRTIAAVEFVMAGLFIALILAIIAIGAPHVVVSNFLGVTPEFWFLPYGVLLFALGGLSSVPIQRQILKGQERNLKKSIILAVLFTAVLYLLFAAVVVGVSGDVTSPEALSGLFDFLGTKIILLGSIFGVVAIATSYMMLGTAMSEIFMFDYKVPRRYAWLLVVLPPFLLYLSGLRTFIDIISLVGVFSIGLECVILLFVFRKAKSHNTREPEFSLRLPTWLLYLLGFVFLAGVVYELVK